MDVDTGGGEFLLALGHPYKNTAATEGYAPNICLCQQRFAPLGVDFRPGVVPEGLPFADNSFDIVMSGHVVGDFFREEVDELTRVAKPGGWLLDVPGDQHRETGRNEQLLADGWEELAYTGTFGKTTYRYRKQVR